MKSELRQQQHFYREDSDDTTTSKVIAIALQKLYMNLYTSEVCRNIRRHYNDLFLCLAFPSNNGKCLKSREIKSPLHSFTPIMQLTATLITTP